MKRWSKMTRPMRRVFLSLATRFGMRKSGLGKLQKDVSSCEYKDVHVMWEMLNREAEACRAYDEKKCHWRFINLARNSNLCRNC